MSDSSGQLLRQLVSFGFAGVASAGTHYAVYVALVAGGVMGPTPATVVGFVVGTGVSFVLNARITFGAEMTGPTAARFTAVTLLGGAINTGLVWGQTAMGIDYRIAGLVAIGVGAAVNFTGHKLWTFRDRAA